MNSLFVLYDQFLSNGDPRFKKWPFVYSPVPTVIMCLAYLYVVKKLGPELMKDRKPFQIREILIMYNLCMVFFSFWQFFMFGYYGWFGDYDWTCQPIDYSDSVNAIGIANICWWYFMSKFIEFLDTIFFVLRKKDNQISFLHVYHHGCLPMIVWIGFKFAPGGHHTLLGFINSFIHIIMYIYYGLAAIGPQLQKYLWWKKYLTVMQMGQFVLLMVHNFVALINGCDFPLPFLFFEVFVVFSFLVLFYNFWRKSYKQIESRIEKQK